MHLQRCRAAASRLTWVEVHRSTTSMQRQACVRLLPSVCRFRLLSPKDHCICRAFSGQSSEPKATPALLEKIKDKELLKVHGFIGGQWVPASDGTTMEVRTPSCRFCRLATLLLDVSRLTRHLQAQVLLRPHTYSSPTHWTVSFQYWASKQGLICAVGQEPSYGGSYRHSTLYEGK